MRTSILVLALFAGVIAAAPSTQPSLKNRLAQNNAKNLAQVEQESGDSWECGLGELPYPECGELSCPCNFTTGIPGLGSGTNQLFSSEVVASNGQVLRSVPDTQFNQICQSNCCEAYKIKQLPIGHIL